MNSKKHTNQYDVVALGELLIDFTPAGTSSAGVPLFGQNPGGAPANVLAMHSRLGGKTAFVGKVGQDAFGSFLADTLAGCGIHTAGLVQSAEENTTLAFVHLAPGGDRSFSFYRKPGADRMLREDEVDRVLVESGGIFHFGAVSLTGGPCRAATHAAVAWARAAGRLVSYDPNYRPPLWQGEEEAKREMLRAVPQADIMKVSAEEMVLLTGEEDLARGAGALAGLGPALVLVSLGAKGAYYHTPNAAGLVPTYDVKTIDTTGAGDAFLGAVLYRLRGLTRQALAGLDENALLDIVQFGNAAGSLATTKYGAIPALPTAEEIERCRSSVPLLRI